MAANSDQHEFEKLNLTLNMSDTPDDLEQTLFDNLDKQIVDENNSARKKKRNRLFFSSSIAASMLISLLVMFRVNMVTSSVALAYEHSREENQITGNIDGGYQQWMSEKGIAIPVKAESIVLSKNCLLGKVKTKHLRFDFAGAQKDAKLVNTDLIRKDVINLFIHNSRDKLIKTKGSSGEINGQKWMLIKLSKEMQVLVLYEKNSHKKQIDEIIKSMSPDRGKMTI